MSEDIIEAVPLKETTAFILIDEYVQKKKVNNIYRKYIQDIKTYFIHSFSTYLHLKISESDAEHLRARYKKLHDSKNNLILRERDFTKRARMVANEILSEKISLEKVRLEETEAVAVRTRYEDERDVVQKELETVEQRDTMAKFELAELKRTHDNLKQSLGTMLKENINLVEPVLTKLKEEVTNFYLVCSFIEF